MQTTSDYDPIAKPIECGPVGDGDSRSASSVVSKHSFIERASGQREPKTCRACHPFKHGDTVPSGQTTGLERGEWFVQGLIGIVDPRETFNRIAVYALPSVWVDVDEQA